MVAEIGRRREGSEFSCGRRILGRGPFGPALLVRHGTFASLDA